jgi:subtilase family serine protease
MKLTTLLKSVALLTLAVSLGFSQSAVTPVAKLAQKAMATGQPLPVMPAVSTPAGQFRSHAWIAAKLNVPTPMAQSLPGFCNTTLQLGTPPSAYYIFCPNGLQAAYGVPSIVGGNGGHGVTVAIVDAYHYAGVESDLNVFSGAMGLPACTIAGGCLKQVNQVGGAPRAASDPGWEFETMLDVEWVHSMAPKAKILLVEGDDASFGNMATAASYAIANADIISNSYGSAEADGETDFDFVWAANKPILFSSGDVGAPATYPCASPGVTCVGGTTLTVNPSYQRVSETAWASSGGGCSLYEPTPTFQSSIPTTCSSRATPDVAADADPHTGVAVLDSGNGGVFVAGGTSLACPVTAALYANVTTARVSFGKPRFGNMNTSLYNAYLSNYAYFYFDVTSGSNGNAAGPGYDLVTGMGVSKAVAMANRFFGLIYTAPPPPLN